MLTAALALLLAVAAVRAWRRAERMRVDAEVRAGFHKARARKAEQERDALAAELDALSIAGPPRIDTTTGSHDALPITDHNRRMLTDYCEGMWQHTANGDAK